MNIQNLSNNDERIVAKFINEEFEARSKNMGRTLVWVNNHINKIMSTRPDVHRAMNNLSSEQMNHVIAEILLPF